MSELDVWGALYFRADLVRLDPQDRLLLLDIAVLIADTEDLGVPDGFLRAEGLNLLPTLPPDSEDRLARLVAAGFLQQIDEPEGWQVIGWTERVQRPRPGLGAGAELAWGQQPVKKRQADRERKKANQARSRDAARGSRLEPDITSS